MENIFSQIDAKINEAQTTSVLTKRRKRGPNLTEQNREDIYQAYLEKVDSGELAKTYGVIESTIKKVIREKEFEQREETPEAAFTVKLDELPLAPEVESDAEAEAPYPFESEPELDEETEPAGVETQTNEVEYLLFPGYDTLEPTEPESESVDASEDEAEKDIEIEALLVHYIFSLYDANILSPFEAATFIRRL